MRTNLRYTYLSRPRYNRYLHATSNNRNRAKRLYNANMKLAQAFHPILSQFEVIFRNALSHKMEVHFSDKDWIINQKTGFMNHPSLRTSHHFLKKSVKKTEDKLTRKSITITSGKIIADQSFGFWVSFLAPHHYALIRGQAIYVFPHKPRTENRASIYSKLADILEFRNRVNHCEPICFNGTTINCNDAMNIRTKLYDLVSWIDPDLVSFLSSLDNIQTKINQLMNI